jgi:hypothetical protein
MLRLAALALLLAPAVQAQTADPARAGLDVALPASFHLQAGLEEALPEHAFYSWVDMAAGLLVSVETHTYFSPAQREAWHQGDAAPELHAHLASSERIALAAFPDAAAFRISTGLGGWTGLSVFSCDAERCLRVDALGAAETPVEMLSALVAGIGL